MKVELIMINLTRHCQNAQKHGDHSHPGGHDATPAADALLIMIATTTMIKMELTTATMTEYQQPPHHHDKHPHRMSQGHIAPPLPPNMNQNYGSTTPISANKSDTTCFILS